MTRIDDIDKEKFEEIHKKSKEILGDKGNGFLEELDIDGFKFFKKTAELFEIPYESLVDVVKHISKLEDCNETEKIAIALKYGEIGSNPIFQLMKELKKKDKEGE